MGNHYFRFKQFNVLQQQSAMKVTTDACLFGAWLARHNNQAERVLDIGAGTGLLTLMLAQQSKAFMHGIEKDKATWAEMQVNFNNSPWANRLSPVYGDVLEYHPGEKFDMVITNPPFFENDLKSPDQNRNRVMHDTDLTLDRLITVVKNLLHPQGNFQILLPYNRTDYFTRLAASHGFYIKRQAHVQQTPKHSFFRSMLHLERNPDNHPISEAIIIKEMNGEYSEPFQILLKEYYLYL